MADFSHAIHVDTCGNCFIEFLIGKTIIYAKWGKLNANTIHLTESGMLNLRDAVTSVPYIIHLAGEMKLLLALPNTVYQDKSSNIH